MNKNKMQHYMQTICAIMQYFCPSRSSKITEIEGELRDDCITYIVYRNRVMGLPTDANALYKTLDDQGSALVAKQLLIANREDLGEDEELTYRTWKQKFIKDSANEAFYNLQQTYRTYCEIKKTGHLKV